MKKADQPLNGHFQSILLYLVTPIVSPEPILYRELEILNDVCECLSFQSLHMPYRN
jgi:hypothetical protein